MMLVEKIDAVSAARRLVFTTENSDIGSLQSTVYFMAYHVYLYHKLGL